MKVKIKRIDKALPLPEYHTPGSVAFDVLARETVTIEPNAIGRVPVNIIVEIPKGYMILLKDRSSTAKKKGLLNTIGFIDQDFCGDEDEIQLQFYNFQKEPVTVERGERLGQGAFVRIDQAEWEEVESMNHNKTRGGFGSTGGHKND
ncbi:MAG: Deoxyuridine 5'-triphosphate nucleotidohydrolase Dut [Candidatus Daviesbacteria bacterium GW2011_GWA2_38_24]|uniref:dUTP diphosphatase n=1 Tax=Candidatus Daviesbacteria bacterium GW2011_GWA2_38_24 TaxID=1618422 RepID=A0A0G0JSC8_9BACT|nr:MAG: Deoxyuridine 5'-triphosphate nucleotidohydrolase Dut [Candidatus Daviesbacteria bacterium GW2011_GWA2_38_24]KKQ80991.1 MAG: Deoxyuridine 5'-triphosphate nucleotidohydrolase Dut [Candidatus Daviesbacteria bacterium GW2011_GWA1_38_7]OGE24411.1 MAG: dUTPase [Candidatus Daviesbacteria bacterium RIFCSPHIGHO2_01_FULL_38_8]